MQYLRYSIRTELDYVHLARACIRFHGLKHPATLPASRSGQRPILWGIPLRLSCCTVVTTSAPCKKFLGIQTLSQRLSSHT